MRERTSWDRNQIAKQAASMRKAEDPRAMNQDHLSQQPSHEKYNIGDSSDFAEDPHPSAGTWKAEYKGDQVDRNEIGMPNFRSDTFKTAAAAKKAAACVRLAQQMLKGASEQAIEDQAVSLMLAPDSFVVETSNRLAGIVVADDDDDKDQDEGQGQAQDKQAKDASDEEEGQSQGDQGQDKQAGEIPPQLKEFVKKKDDDKGDKGDDDKGDDKGQDKQASSKKLAAQAVSAIRSGDKVAGARFIEQLTKQASGVQADVQEMLQQAMQQQSQQDPAMFAQQQAEQIAQQLQQQAPMAQQGQPQQQQAPMAQQGQPQQQMAQDDDLLLDQMLQDDLQQPVLASDEIEIEGSSMDMNETILTGSDDALLSLFANGSEYRDAVAAAEAEGNPVVQTQVTANTRTASHRTVGTRPTKGVSQLGGAPAPASNGRSVDDISSLWRTDPDVSNVFR